MVTMMNTSIDTASPPIVRGTDHDGGRRRLLSRPEDPPPDPSRPPAAAPGISLGRIRWLTFFMFMMFALTTDSVGVIIPRVIREFGLSMTQAGAFHYATMIAIAVAGISLGFLADTIGRKKTIILGLLLFSANSYLFVLGNSFAFFLGLLIVSGMAIGIFKTGALALVGDISKSSTEHTATMNAVEGFFGVGAIIGPALVTGLLNMGVSWKWLYVIAGTLCLVLTIVALCARYPEKTGREEEPVSPGMVIRMVGNPYALGFSLAAFLYVAVECAIYVWMPTLVAGYTGRSAVVAAYGISIFFIFRAAGRFLGAWVLSRFEWTAVLAAFSTAILLCFAGTMAGGIEAAVYLLPLSGLFMSMIYPTINSKGISCFPKAQHGSVAGVILFFTAAAAALGPLAMGAVSDHFGSLRYGFALATVLAALLSAGLVANWVFKPAGEMLRRLEGSEYAPCQEAPAPGKSVQEEVSPCAAL